MLLMEPGLGHTRNCRKRLHLQINWLTKNSNLGVVLVSVSIYWFGGISRILKKWFFRRTGSYKEQAYLLLKSHSENVFTNIPSSPADINCSETGKSNICKVHVEKSLIPC